VPLYINRQIIMHDQSSSRASVLCVLSANTVPDESLDATVSLYKGLNA
jgi:hypothetical protein